MSSRDRILGRLRSARTTIEDPVSITDRRSIVPLNDLSQIALQDRFVAEAEKLACQVYRVDSDQDGVERVLTIIGEHKKLLCWDFAHIPLDGLEPVLQDTAVQIADGNDADAQVGITGIDAALAATGSLVLQSGDGKPRGTSLLPLIHIAIMTVEQIVPDLESWIARQRQSLHHFQEIANTVVISGPSRTADIGMELVMGAHGPAELHIVLLG